MVDELKEISEFDFYRLFFSKKPVLLKDYIKDSDCYKTWSFDYLKDKIGSRPVKVRHIQTGIFNQDSELLDMGFDNLIDLAASSQPNSRSYYLQATPVNAIFPEFDGILPKPQLINDLDLVREPLIWIGAKGCVSPLHYDYYENFLVQIRGTKTLSLFSPNDTQYLYPNVDPPRHLSAINLEHLDIKSFPLFQKAHPFECTISEGDVLYIPPNWWHHVQTVDASISINYWFERFDIQQGHGFEESSVEQLVEYFQRFLVNGASIDHKDVEGEYLLIKAVNYGYKNVVESLLKLGANASCISSICEPGVNAVQLAKKQKKQKILQLLMNYINKR